MYGGNPPPLVNAPNGGGDGAGFIPPPPNAHYGQPEVYNPYPSAAPFPATVNPPWVPHATASFWPNYGPPSPSPWAPDVRASWQPAQPGLWSPYAHPTPAPSWGNHTPAILAPPMPLLGQPIGGSPHFNMRAGDGDQHADPDAGPERRRRPSFGGPSPSYGELPLARAHSQDPLDGYSGGSPLQRAWSTGATAGRSRSRVRSSFARAQPERYELEDLARRPRDWRQDYRRLIPKRLKPWSDFEEFTDPIKRIISPILSYHSRDPNVIWGLSSFPDPWTLTFPILARVYNHIDFAQLATNPPVDQMRLFHPLLPWYIDVYKKIDNGVTVEDVIMQVYSQLRTQIHARHYYNQDLGSEIRERIAGAYAHRTQDKEDERLGGIRWVDYLEDQNIFMGLVRSCNGLWEMKTRSIHSLSHERPIERVGRVLQAIKLT